MEKRFSVSLCLSIEAETEEEAAEKFRKQVIEDMFGGESMEIELEE